MKMNVDKRRIYWIIVAASLTAFGAYELYQLFNTYINDSIATKSSTLTLDADLLTKNLGITFCNSPRPNWTYLQEHNISKNVFNYALSFYSRNPANLFQIVGDPSLLRLELTKILDDNITAESLKRFFRMASTRLSTPVSMSSGGTPLRLKDVTYQASAICNQYAFEYKGDLDWRLLEQGYTVIHFRHIFLEEDQDDRHAYISIYNYEDIIHPATSANFVPLLFRRNVHYVSQMNVHVTKYVRKFHCKPAPEHFIAPIDRAKVLCIDICTVTLLFTATNCSRISGDFNEILKSAPVCSFYDMDVLNITDEALNVPKDALRQCAIDHRCNQLHYCMEWGFNINVIVINEFKPNKIYAKNDTDTAFGSHDVLIQFLANSYLIEEVDIMTIDMLLASIGGILGLLCGFELTMVAKFFFDHGCSLVTRLFNGRFCWKRSRVVSDPIGLKCVDVEIGSDDVFGAFRDKCEITITKINEI